MHSQVISLIVIAISIIGFIVIVITIPILTVFGPQLIQELGSCKGSEFVFTSYKVCIDFGTCNGIVEVIWHGQIDYHYTTRSITTIGFTKIGTSIQISQQLVSIL